MINSNVNFSNLQIYVLQVPCANALEQKYVARLNQLSYYILELITEGNQETFLLRFENNRSDFHLLIVYPS